MNATRRTRPLASGPLVIGGLVFVAAYVAILLALMEWSTWDTWGAMFVLPVLFVVALPAFARQAQREGDRKVFWILVIALSVKMAFSVFRYYHVFQISDSGSDARQYNTQATEIALRFLNGDFTTGLSNFMESNFMRLFTALIYTVVRPSVLSAFFVYAWLAFWGTYFFYRAFVLAVPDGDRRGYMRWLFFMPSILFWPSSIGKEAWMMFGLGIAAFGAAKVLRERMIPGLFLTALGLGLAALVRAPIAVAMGSGLIAAGVLRRASRPLAQLSPLVKFGSVALFAAIGIVLAAVMSGYLARSGFEQDSVDEILVTSEDQTAQGGSEFTPSPINSPASLVVGSVTVLFRPFISEAHTPEALGTAVEASFLALVALLRWRSFVAAIRNIRRVPYVAFALIYVAASIYMLSPVANFGILVRQRTLLLPAFLALMCFLPSRRALRRKVRENGSTVAEKAVPIPATTGAVR